MGLLVNITDIVNVFENFRLHNLICKRKISLLVASPSHWIILFLILIVSFVTYFQVIISLQPLDEFKIILVTSFAQSLNLIY